MLLVVFRHRWRDPGRAPVPPLLTRSIAGRVVLVAGVVFFVLMTVGGLFTVSQDDIVSAGGAAVVILLECAGGCAYLLLKGQRSANRRRVLPAPVR